MPSGWRAAFLAAKEEALTSKPASRDDPPATVWPVCPQAAQRVRNRRAIVMIDRIWLSRPTGMRYLPSDDPGALPPNAKRRTTMTLHAGREFLAIPGPTTVPDEVLRAMHRPAVDIYAGPLLALTESLHRDIARVFQTAGRAYIYIANGHGAWEASLTNVLSKGDKILVLESGRFAVGWGENARRMGVEVEVLKGDMRHAVRPSKVEARLRADKGSTIKAILVAQIDTASG